MNLFASIMAFLHLPAIDYMFKCIFCSADFDSFVIIESATIDLWSYQQQEFISDVHTYF